MANDRAHVTASTGQAMSELRLVGGYRSGLSGEQPPRLGLRRMLTLALRTWPFMRPMLKHLVILLALASSGILTVLVGGLVGTDLLTNKVLLGDKLQPLQARVLFLGDDYVTTDPQLLGQSESEPAPYTEDADVATPASPALSPEQRRTVRDRLVAWGIVGGVLGALLTFGGYYYSVWIWQNVNQNLRVAMVERAESLSLKYHSHARVGDAIFRVYQDSAMIVNLIQSGIAAPLFSAYSLFVALAVVAAFDPWFAATVVAVGVPMLLLAVKATPHIRRRALANRTANSDLLSYTQEAFSALKVVKANGAEARLFDRFGRDSQSALNAAYFLRLDMVLATLVVALLGGGVLVLGEYWMVSWALEERETFLGASLAALIGFAIWNYGAVVSARGRVDELGAGARGLLGVWLRMQDLFIALERAFYLLDIEPDVVDRADPAPFPAPIERVAWHGVAFSYDADRPVLAGVDLEATRGTTTAIVGATGAGKSTLMALLLRLYDPAHGQVVVNDEDLRDLAVDDIRANTAIALQKNVLFADTVAANIAFGAPHSDRGRIEAAAQVACAADFIRALPNGYDTHLGERGGKLSAGQRQRLSIARAVLRDTPILILDEPTAALDAKTEQAVLANLAAWGTQRVIFLITHRLATIRSADQIAFLEHGRVAERGTHSDLMAMPAGRYRAFVNQSLGTDD